MSKTNCAEDGRSVISKTAVMQYVIRGLMHECFDHEHEGRFDVTFIRENLADLGAKREEVELSDIIPHILSTRVTEPSRVMQLSRDSWNTDPGIIVEIDCNGEKSHIMVDGHHRALRRNTEGLTTMWFWFVPMSEYLRPAAGWVENPWFTWGDSLESKRG